MKLTSRPKQEITLEYRDNGTKIPDLYMNGVKVSKDPIQEVKLQLSVQLDSELDQLVDHISDFLEITIAKEFDELATDIKELAAQNKVDKNIIDHLMEENMRLSATCQKLQGILERVTDAMGPEERLFKTGQRACITELRL